MGGTSNHFSEIILIFLESVEHREWEKLQSYLRKKLLGFLVPRSGH
jgi:hypothetical protein